MTAPVAPATRRRDAVLAGLSTPSVEALLVAVAVVVVLFGAAGLRLGPEHLRTPGYFVLDAEDSPGFATSAVMGAAARSPERVALILLGGSGLREAVSSVSALEGAVEAHSGVDVDVHLLVSSAQSMAESAAILDVLPPGPGVVVVGVGPNRFAKDGDAQGASLGVDLPRLSDGPRSGVYAVDHSSFLVPRLFSAVRALVWGPIPQQLHQYRDAPKKPARSWKKYRSALTGTFAEMAGPSLEELRSLVADARAKGMEPVLLDTPSSPERHDFADLEAVEADYQARMVAFVAEHGVPRLGLDEAAGLAEDDFVDWIHLRRAAAADRYTEQLALALAPRLRGAP